MAVSDGVAHPVGIPLLVLQQMERVLHATLKTEFESCFAVNGLEAVDKSGLGGPWRRMIGSGS
jgi:hypothetical protein